MNSLIEEIEYKDHTIEVHIDPDPINPREKSDNFGHMVCFHDRYILGDTDHSFNDPEEVREFLIEKFFENNDCIFLPLFLYDHSGITMSTSNFPCEWDSGQVGIIYVTKQEAIAEFTARKGYKNKALYLLQTEVATYDKFLTGQMYGYQITTPDDGFLDSCWGFDDIEYMVSEAQTVIDN